MKTSNVLTEQRMNCPFAADQSEQILIFADVTSGIFSGVFLPNSAILQHVQGLRPAYHGDMQAIVAAILTVNDDETRRALLVQMIIRIRIRFVNHFQAPPEEDITDEDDAQKL